MGVSDPLTWHIIPVTLHCQHKCSFMACIPNYTNMFGKTSAQSAGYLAAKSLLQNDPRFQMPMDPCHDPVEQDYLVVCCRLCGKVDTIQR